MTSGWWRTAAARLTGAFVGLALGGLGLGWHGRPTDAVIERAIRARSADHSLADIAIVTVARNWTYEMFDIAGSQFMVTATVTPRDAPASERCFGIEPGFMGTAIAYGPYADWRCRFPF